VRVASESAVTDEGDAMRIWMWIAGLLLLGCGAGSDGGAGGAGEAAGDDAARAAQLEQVVALAAARGADPAAETARLQAGLQAMDAFAEVGVSDDGTVWGRFPDDEIVLVVHNREPAAKVEKSGLFVTPGGTDAVVLNALGTCFHSPAGELRDWLTSAGYHVGPDDASVDALENLGKPAAFYIDAHGGVAPKLKGEAFGVWTSTAATPAEIKAHRAEVKRGELVYMVANHDLDAAGNCQPAAHLGITAAFVKKHLRFTGNAFAFVNACSSDDADLKNAFFSAGVQLYAGWTQPVPDPAAFTAGEIVLDRMLGAREAEPKIKEGQQPQVAPNILAELTARGLNPVTDGTGATVTELRLTHHTHDHTPLLVPSVTRAMTQEDAGTLLVLGMFPSDVPVTITVDGTALPTTQLNDNALQAPIPPAVTGEVRVQAGDLVSNAVMLAGWHVHARLDHVDPCGAHFAIDCQLLFRADVPWRPILLTDEDTPRPGDPFDQYRASVASHCDATAEGACDDASYSVARPDLAAAYDDEGQTDVEATLHVDAHGHTFQLALGVDADDALLISHDGHTDHGDLFFDAHSDTHALGDDWSFADGDFSHELDTLHWGATTPMPVPGFRTALDQ
jgi:hypothetical protein